jgi:hypothetical protein
MWWPVTAVRAVAAPVVGEEGAGGATAAAKWRGAAGAWWRVRVRFRVRLRVRARLRVRVRVGVRRRVRGREVL